MGSLALDAPPGPPDPTNPEFARRLSVIVANILVGKLNNTGSVTLNNGGVAGFNSTTVSDVRCGPDSVINLMATSANAAVALDQWRVSTITNGSFTITHISTSTADCTAKYTVIG